jgi:hypothetical protein
MREVRDADAESMRRACFDAHAAWLRRLAAAGGGFTEHGDGIEWTLTRKPYDEMTVAVFGEPTRGIRDDLDRIGAYCRDHRIAAVSCWRADQAHEASLGVWLGARGFRPCDPPQWMVLDIATHRDATATSHPYVVSAPDRLENWTVPELLCFHPVAKHIRQAMLEVEPRRVWHLVWWQDGRPVGNVSVNVTDGDDGVASLHDLYLPPAAAAPEVAAGVLDDVIRFVDALGHRHIVINATDNASTLRWLGFRDIGVGATWSLPRHAVFREPGCDEVALAEAVGGGDLDALAALTDRVEPVLDRPLPNGMSPLAFAAHHQQPQVAGWLLDHGATPDLLAMWKLGWRDEAAALLARDVTIARTLRRYSGKTLLHVAVEQNDAALARMLLAGGADPSIRDSRYDATPLEWAIELGRHDLAALLTDHAAAAEGAKT